jgi:hypothetical protein
MPDTEKIARIRLSLNDIRPENWRRVELPVTSSLKGLHDVIQAVIGWNDCHLHVFKIGERLYGIPDPDGNAYQKVYSSKSVKLQAVIDKGMDQFDYAYDFGDDWHVTVVIEAIEDADPNAWYPRFVDGARHGPPEDCGGPPGYEGFVKAMSGKRTAEKRRLTEWFGGPFDPEDLDLRNVQDRMGWIAQRRHAGKDGYHRSAARLT